MDTVFQKRLGLVRLPGNGCGHVVPDARYLIRNDPYKIKAEQDEGGYNRRPMVVYEIIEKMQSFYDDPAMLPTLNGANASTRQMRSERREAVVSLLEQMLLNIDIASMRIGDWKHVYGQWEFHYKSLYELASGAGISYSRAKRAYVDLRRAGIMCSKKIARPKDDGSGNWESVAHSKWFAEPFFSVFGQKIERWVKHEKKKAYQRWTAFLQKFKRDQAATAKGRGQAGLYVQAMANQTKDAMKKIGGNVRRFNRAQQPAAASGGGG